MPGIVVEIGTGDGKFAYELAKSNPELLVIALDPNHNAMKKISLKANKKSAKGGLANLVFGLASIEELPAELTDKVNQVFINFPWAGLLQKLLNVDKAAWGQLQRICQKGALIDIVFSTSQRDPFKQVSKEDLAMKLSLLGLQLNKFQTLSSTILKNYPSTWAKKLAFGKDRAFYYMRVTNV